MVAEEDDPASWGPGNFPYQTSAGGGDQPSPFSKTIGDMFLPPTWRIIPGLVSG